MPTTEDTLTANKPAQASLLDNAIPTIERMGVLMARADDGRVGGLRNVVSGLEDLEGALAAGRSGRVARLNRFESGEALARLETLAAERLTEFDALDLIGQFRLGSGADLWGWELFHSRVLAWLLDPKRNHGHGDRFLKHFLDCAGAGLTGRSADWSETVVIREWGHVVDGQRGFLDILMVNKARRVLCAIENKVFAGEHGGQLTLYREALEQEYPTFTRYHVFLTPRGDLASEEEEREYWTPLTYSAVFDIIQEMLEDDGNSTNEDVRAFMRQYATTLRRNIMPDTNVAQVARRIYLEHKEAIDEIIDHKPDWVAEAKPWFKEAVAKRTEWILDVEDKNFVRFRSADWDEYETSRLGTGWAPDSKALLLFRFKLRNGGFWLDFALSPTKKKKGKRIRRKLFKAVQQHPHLFKPTATKMTDDFLVLHEEDDYILDDADYGIGWDDGSTRVKVEEWVTRFAEKQFPAMNEVIVNCLREYEAEERS